MGNTIGNTNVYLTYSLDKENIYYITEDNVVISSDNKSDYDNIFTPKISDDGTNLSIKNDSFYLNYTNVDEITADVTNTNMQNVVLGNKDDTEYQLKTFYEFKNTDGVYLYPDTFPSDILTSEQKNNNVPIYLYFKKVPNRALIISVVIIFILVLLVIIGIIVFFVYKKHTKNNTEVYDED